MAGRCWDLEVLGWEYEDEDHATMEEVDHRNCRSPNAPGSISSVPARDSDAPSQMTGFTPCSSPARASWRSASCGAGRKMARGSWCALSPGSSLSAPWPGPSSLARGPGTSVEPRARAASVELRAPQARSWCSAPASSSRAPRAPDAPSRDQGPRLSPSLAARAPGDEAPRPARAPRRSTSAVRRVPREWA